MSKNKFKFTREDKSVRGDSDIDIICRREKPTECYHCCENMYRLPKDGDEISNMFTVAVYECRNGHRRTVYIDKEVK